MNHFDIKARNWERRFVKRLSSGVMVCMTGSLKENLIEKVTHKAFYFKTAADRAPQSIPREKVRGAISFLLFRRTTMRKQLEQFHHFNSFLMGLLRLIFVHISKISLTPKGLRLTLRGVRFIPAGMDRDPRKIQLAKKMGTSVILCSYFHLRDDLNENFRVYCRKFGVKILLDSGAWSLFSAQEKGKNVEPIHVRHLLQFIKRHQDILYGWINLDDLKSPVATRIHQKVMERAGVMPIPVWHAKSSIDELGLIVRQYESEVDFICIGGLAKASGEERIEVLDRVFEKYPNCNFHILGVSSPEILRYPVFSVDSTAPIWSHRKRFLITENGQVLADKVNQNWDGEDCFVYNMSYLNRLEDAYEGHEMQLPILPEYPKRNLQLAFF
jgi:hypothetical protein